MRRTQVVFLSDDFVQNSAEANFLKPKWKIHLTFSSAILPKIAVSLKKSILRTQSCPGSSRLQRLARANTLGNPYGRSRLVAGNCFRPGSLRRCPFDVEPTRRRFKLGYVSRGQSRMIRKRIKFIMIPPHGMADFCYAPKIQPAKEKKNT